MEGTHHKNVLHGHEAYTQGIRSLCGLHRHEPRHRGGPRLPQAYLVTTQPWVQRCGGALPYAQGADEPIFAQLVWLTPSLACPASTQASWTSRRKAPSVANRSPVKTAMRWFE